MDRFVSMNVFVRVVEKGSFAAAADVSGITAQMVGNHIRQLERHLGIRLVTRTTRQHTLTETGKEYYQQCLRVLELLEEAEVSAREMRQRPRGRLRVTAPISFGSVCLAPVLVDYLDLYPDVSVELLLDDRVLDIAKQQIDVAIRIGTVSDSQTLTARALRPWRRVFCASPEYLAKYGEPGSVDELNRYRCLSFDYATGPEQEYRLSSTTGEKRVVQVAPSVAINNGHALLASAASGLGIILQPEELVRKHVEVGLLKQVLPEWSTEASPLSVVYVLDRQMTPKLRTFIDFIIGRFR